MDDVAKLPASDRADLFRASAEKRGFNVVIVEKDFWVCWVLKRLFTLPDPPAGLVFKGGTSLSKVYGVIERFSEDVDLSFDRSDLGFGGDADPLQAGSKKKQQAQIKALLNACATMIHDELLPQLQAAIVTALGGIEGWRLEFDPHDTEQQTLQFHYPTSGFAADGAGYLRPFVRLETGARGEPWPHESAEVSSFAAEDFPSAFKAPAFTVNVIAAERTFWEKATILHMWHRAGLDKHLSDRQSRHYYDVVKLYRSAVGERAMADFELLRSVAAHKNVFFARAWAKFDEAVPGTLRLMPADHIRGELERDYAKMRNEMIYGDAPPLAELLEVLQEIEDRVNAA